MCKTLSINLQYKLKNNFKLISHCVQTILRFIIQKIKFKIRAVAQLVTRFKSGNIFY